MFIKKKIRIPLELSREAAARLYALALKESDRLSHGETPAMASERTPYVKACKEAGEAREFALTVKVALESGRKIGVL